MACRAARRVLSDALDLLVLCSSCSGRCSVSRRPGSRRSRSCDRARIRSITRPCCGKARRNPRTAQSFPLRMRVAPTMGRVTPTPTAASAINLSRPFPEVSDPRFPISSAAKRCKVKSTRRNRAGLFVATADFRASAPRSARARSRPDTATVALPLNLKHDAFGDIFCP